MLNHGFRFRPIWWTPRVSAEWGSFLTELPALDRGYRRINRADLVSAPTRGLPQALVSGYVWGTGSSAFLVGRRARVIRDNDETRIADCLQSVADQLRLGNPTDAYESMLRGHPNNLKHLGPSFFTKFLYAADAEGTRPGRALILDQFVAVALKDLDGWDISRNGPWSRPLTSDGSSMHMGSQLQRACVPMPWRWPISTTAKVRVEVKQR